jgi:hypothetical protein
MAALEAKAEQLESRLEKLERSLAGAFDYGSCRAAPETPGIQTRASPCPHNPKHKTGLAVAGGGAPASAAAPANPSASASVSKADLLALRDLLVAAKQERDALAKAKAQAEERAERLEYRVSMLVASLREADRALGKPPPPPMPDRSKGAAGAAAAAAADEQEDEDDAAADELA